jgi:DNA polymerase III subunit epsilon
MSDHWTKRASSRHLADDQTQSSTTSDAFSQPSDDAANDEQRIVLKGNSAGELYGEVLVFTGALTNPRREAASYAAQMGYEVGGGTTKRILVVGDQDLRLLVGHRKSGKHRKAAELIKRGQRIRILRETDFRELVNLSA